MIPIVIFHVGNQDYFQKCVQINSKKNHVYIIGDDSNKDTFINHPNITHVHKNDLESDEIAQFKQCNNVS